jgi:hypothetical protein
MGSEDEMRRMEQQTEKESIYREPGVSEPAPALRPEPQTV